MLKRNTIPMNCDFRNEFNRNANFCPAPIFSPPIQWGDGAALPPALGPNALVCRLARLASGLASSVQRACCLARFLPSSLGAKANEKE